MDHTWGDAKDDVSKSHFYILHNILPSLLLPPLPVFCGGQGGKFASTPRSVTDGIRTSNWIPSNEHRDVAGLHVFASIVGPTATVLQQSFTPDWFWEIERRGNEDWIWVPVWLHKELYLRPFTAFLGDRLLSVKKNGKSLNSTSPGMTGVTHSDMCLPVICVSPNTYPKGLCVSLTKWRPVLCLPPTPTLVISIPTPSPFVCRQHTIWS